MADSTAVTQRAALCQWLLLAKPCFPHASVIWAVAWLSEPCLGLGTRAFFSAGWWVHSSGARKEEACGEPLTPVNWASLLLFLREIPESRVSAKTVCVVPKTNGLLFFFFSVCCFTKCTLMYTCDYRGRKVTSSRLTWPPTKTQSQKEETKPKALLKSSSLLV